MQAWNRPGALSAGEPDCRRATGLLGDQEKKGVSAVGTAEGNFASGGRTLEREDCIEVTVTPKLKLWAIMYSTTPVSTLF